MQFYSAYNRPPQNSSPVGSRVDPTYAEDLEGNGKVVVKRVGFTDRYAMTQEAKTPDVYDMLRDTGLDPDRVQASSASLEGMIDDFTAVPRSIPEAVALSRKAEQAFLDLSLDVRAEFDNDSCVLLASLSDGSFAKRMSKFIVQPQKKEVKDE